MKFTLFVYVLVVGISVFKFNVTSGFRLKINELNKNSEVEGVNNSAGDSNNTNNNVIKVENNQGSEEIEKISQVRDRHDVNFKSDQVPRLLRTPLHQQTVSDQFYDNTGSLGGIQGEKIATDDKKLENISELKSLEAIIDFKNKLGEKTWKLVSKMINNPYDVSKMSIHLNKKCKEPPEILKAPCQSPRSKRQNQDDMELNKNDLFSSEFARIPKDNEQNRISNIKHEISKLQSLVQILKDQQSILNLLDEVSNDTMDVNTFENTANLNNSDSTNWIQSGIDDLDQTENERNGNDKFKLSLTSSSNLTEDLNAIKVKLNELKYLFTREVLPKLNEQSSDREKMKIYIDRELARQKNDLLKMKRLILHIFKQLFENNKINPIHNFPTDNNNGDDEFKEILKELKILEKNMSKILSQRASFKNEIVEMNIDTADGGGTETSVEDPSLVKAQMTLKEGDDDIENDLDDLLDDLEIKTSTEKIENKKLNDLLKELDQSENDSFEVVSKEHGNKLSESDEIEVTKALMGFVKLLDENFNSETKTNRILNRFRKILSTQTKHKKSDDRLMAEVLRSLLNKAHSKSFDQNIDDDKDMMTRLKELSHQIDKLQQKDENVDEENNNFQILLQELINKKEQKKIEKEHTRPKLKLTKIEMAKLLRKLIDVPVETTKNLPQAGRYKCEILTDYNDKLEKSPHFIMHHVSPNYINDNLQNWFKFNSNDSPNLQIPIAKYDTIPTPNNKVFDQNYLRPNPVNYLFRGTPTTSVQFENPAYFEEINRYFNTPHTGQYPIDVPEDSSSDVQKKIEQLQRQLNSLGMVIRSLGQPEYARRKDDMKIVDDLNNQINHLKYVIDDLSYVPNLKHYGNFEAMDKGEAYRNVQNNNNDVSYRQIEKDQNNQLNYLEENRNLITNPRFRNNPIQLQIRDENIPPTHTYSDPNLILSPNSAIFKAKIEKNNPNGADALQSNTEVQKIRRDTQHIDSERLRSLLLRLLEDGIEDDETSHDNKFEDFDKQNDLESEDENDSSLPESARSSVFKVNRRHNSKKRLKKLNIFDKIFTKILDKIIDKLQIAIPRIIERLFGLNQFYGNTYQNYGYGSNVIQTFRNFGITGYFPLIILKGVYSLSFLMSELQKVPFIRNFLVPFGIVGLVAASTVFLIYWLQPNLYQSELYSADQNVQPYNSYNPYKYSHYSNTYPVRTYNNDYTNNRLYPFPGKYTVKPSNNYYKSNAYNNYYNGGNMYRNVYPSGYS